MSWQNSKLEQTQPCWRHGMCLQCVLRTREFRPSHFSGQDLAESQKTKLILPETIQFLQKKDVENLQPPCDLSCVLRALCHERAASECLLKARGVKSLDIFSSFPCLWFLYANLFVSFPPLEYSFHNI